MNSFLQKKINLSFVFFSIGFFMLQISSIWVNVVFLKSYLTILYRLSIVLIAVGAGFKLSGLNLKFIHWFICFVLICISIVSYYLTSDSIILQFVLIFICCINVDFNKVVKTDLFIKKIVLVFLLVFYFLGMTDEIEVMRNGTVRKSFGFFHPNTFSMFVTMMFFEYIYLNKDKITILKGLFGLGLAIFISIVSDSRTSLLCILIFLSLLIFKKYSNTIFKNYVVSFIVKNLYLIITIFTLVFTILYNDTNSFIVYIDKLFSRRIYIQNIFYNEYSINLIGNVVDYTRTLDNAYIRIILNYGIIGYALFYYLYNKIITLSIKNKDYIIFIMFITFCLGGLMENLMFRIVYNIFWIYCLKNMFLKKENNEADDERKHKSINSYTNI